MASETLRRTVDIRSHLHEWINAECAAGAVVIGEYGVGSSISDVAVFEPCGLRLFEIKSDQDSVTRLSTQARDYSAHAVKSYLVCGDRLLGYGTALVSPGWGVLRDTEHGIEVVRAPVANHALSPFAVCEALWREEALAELRERGLAAGMSKRDRVWLRSALAKASGVEDLQRTVYAHVARRKWNLRKSGCVRFVPARAA